MRNKSATQTQRKQANDDNLHFLDVRLCNWARPIDIWGCDHVPSYYTTPVVGCLIDRLDLRISDKVRCDPEPRRTLQYVRRNRSQLFSRLRPWNDGARLDRIMRCLIWNNQSAICIQRRRGRTSSARHWTLSIHSALSLSTASCLILTWWDFKWEWYLSHWSSTYVKLN